MAKVTNAQAAAAIQTVNSDFIQAADSGSIDAAGTISEEIAGVQGIPQADFTSSTQISSLSELRTLYPKLYNMIVQGIAQNMMIDFGNGNDRVIAAMKKIREDNP